MWLALKSWGTGALTLKWHPEINDPTFAGWTCTAAYIVTSGLCGWAALTKGRSTRDTKKSRGSWLAFTGALLLLGINKQLDLQTFLIDFGRELSLSEGWYEQRRKIQALFAALFAIAIAVGIILFVRKNREFLREQRVAVAGAAILGVFLLLRASTVNHVLAAHIGDENWGWLLEVTGNFCIAIAAFKHSRNAE